MRFYNIEKLSNTNTAVIAGVATGLALGESKKYANLGETCAENNDCASNLFCKENICSKLKDGDACNNRYECESDWCNQFTNKCGQRGDIGADCKVSGDCKEGICDINTNKCRLITAEEKQSNENTGKIVLITLGVICGVSVLLGIGLGVRSALKNRKLNNM
jgi:hypothetical protein